MEITGEKGVTLNECVRPPFTFVLQIDQPPDSVGEVLVRLSTGLSRNLRLRVPEPLHPHGPQHYHGSPVFFPRPSAKSISRCEFCIQSWTHSIRP